MKRKWKVLLVGLVILIIVTILLSPIYLQNFLKSKSENTTEEPETPTEPEIPEEPEIPAGKIAFISGGDIYIMNADGSNQTKLIDGRHEFGGIKYGYSILDFSISPDGKKIAYVAPGFFNETGWKEDIYLVNINGSGLVKLTEDSERDMDPSWSPDGKKIVFAANRKVGDWTYPMVYVMNADGSNQTRLTELNSFHPAWSPDGKKIVFVYCGIYIMNADGSNIISLTNNIDDFEPAWSPDGRKIAFTSNRDGNDGIYIMNADGSNKTKLTGAGENSQPCWLPE